MNQRHRVLWIFLSACFLGSGSAARAQTVSPSRIAAPLAGLLANPETTEVCAIEGVPGASIIGNPIALPVGVLRVHLAPAQGWALVEQAPAGTLGVMTFSGIQPGSVIPIDNAMSAPDIVSFSPVGKSAVVVSNAAAMLQVLTRLDGTPELTMQTAISGLGEVSAAAVSDDGTSTVALTSDGRVFLLSSTQTPQSIFQAGSPVGLSFLPGQPAVAIVDGGAATISVIDGLNSAPFTRIGMPGPSLSGDSVLVQASSDAQSLFVAANGGTSAYRVGLANQSVLTLAVPAVLSQLERLRGGDIFLFSANPGEAAWLLLSDGPNFSVAFAQWTGGHEARRIPPMPPRGRR